MKIVISIGFSMLLLLLIASQVVNRKLETIFNHQIHSLVKGELQYSNFSTSFFKNFPELSIKFSHVILLNDTSKIDTLVKLESIQANFSAWSFFESQLLLTEVKFNNAEIFLDYLEKWKIFKRNWTPSQLNLKKATIHIPFSSWIYYRKKQKISYYPNLPTIEYQQINPYQNICTPVLIRKQKRNDFSRMECMNFNLIHGELTFLDSTGVFRREGLKSIEFYEQ